MWFWWFMLVCDLLVPVIMVGAGYMMWKHTPEKINGIYGYRTKRSMRNNETWKFAHDYCGQLWWKGGWGMFVVSLVLHFPVYGSTEDAIGILGAVLCTLQCVGLLVPVVLTERALKRTFTDEGVWRR